MEKGKKEEEAKKINKKETKGQKERGVIKVEEKEITSKKVSQKRNGKINASKNEKKEESVKIAEKKNDEKAKEPKDLLKVKKQEMVETIEPEKLEEIEKVIKKQKTMPQMHQKKMMQRVFENIVLAVVFMLYFFFINMGAMHIGEETFLTDLHVFSLFILAVSIYLFEVAYQKDKGRIAIHGIEVLVMAIITLLSLYLYQMKKEQFPILLNIASFIFAIYFVGKSIYIYVKMKKRGLKQNSDIQRIAKIKE